MDILAPTVPPPLPGSFNRSLDDPVRAANTLPVRFDPEPAAANLSSLDDCRRILIAADAILEQGEALLRGLSPKDYTYRLPLVFNASMGGHYRHCLDHFSSFFRGLDQFLVDYDDRDRDLKIETEPLFALKQTQAVRHRLALLSPSSLNAEISAKCEISYAAGEPPCVASSIARELIYAIAHAIHHYALISVMAGLLGVRLPTQFGVAPSTVAYLNKTKRVVAANQEQT